MVGGRLSAIVQLSGRSILAQIFNRLVAEFDKSVLQQARFDTNLTASIRKELRWNNMLHNVE